VGWIYKAERSGEEEILRGYGYKSLGFASGFMLPVSSHTYEQLKRAILGAYA
jgi:hypothetical protein